MPYEQTKANAIVDYFSISLKQFEIIILICNTNNKNIFLFIRCLNIIGLLF